MRRNDVVFPKEGTDYCFYGRVVRTIGDKVLWIDCGLHIYLTTPDILEVVDYKGRREWTGSDELKTYYHRIKGDWYPDFGRIKFQREALFQRMPSLRKLKQMASRYHGRNVWKTSLDYEFLRKDAE